MDFTPDTATPSFDVHQHIWPEGVLRALERRHTAPLARRRDGVWEIRPASEPAFRVAAEDQDPRARVALLPALGVDRALVALSAPVGIETLPPAEAEPVLDAWQAATEALPGELSAWAALAVDDPDPARLDAALDAGAIGLSLPAGALAGPRSLERLGPLLERLEERLAPLFVHPGPPHPSGASTVGWWGPCTSYLADLHAAWHAFAAWGRPAHPGVRVVFAALAGLAPLHAERAALRGGPVYDEPDPLIFYDTSSYGPRARRAIVTEIGQGQLVYGTDTPVVPVRALDPRAPHDLLARDNARRLLGLAWVAA